MKIEVRLDKDAAVLAGFDYPEEGKIEVYVKPADLTENQREVVVYCRYSLTANNVGHLISGVESITSLLDAAGVVMQQRRKKEAAEKAEIQAWKEDKIELILSAPIDDLLIPADRLIYGSKQPWVTSPISAQWDRMKFPGPYSDGEAAIREVLKDERVAAKVQEAEDLAASINHEVKMKHTQAEEARKTMERERAEEKRKEDEAGKKARKNQLDEWVQRRMTPVQQQRWAEGLMRNAEVIDSIRDSVFKPLEALPLFKRISDEDVIQEFYTTYGEEPSRDSIEIWVEKANSVSDRQFLAVKEMEKRVPGATVEVREHLGQSTVDKYRDERAYVARLAVKVTIQEGELTLSREYALE